MRTAGKLGVTWLAAMAAAVAPMARAAEEDAHAQQGANASRYTYAHWLPLYDAEGNRIALDDDPLMPFSTRHTCGRCHDYETISGGWHFNAFDPGAPRGRAGQPWVLVDRRTGTQLALSRRGAFGPGGRGLSRWRFVQLFGRHMPGGGAGEGPAERPDPKARWAVSGRLEINCLACHSRDRADDMNQWYVQIGAGNLMWAPAGMSAIATVRGAAAAMPETFDPFMEPDSEKAPNAPRVTYDKGRFDPTGRVFFDVVRRAPATRCYFCHSNATVGAGAPEEWRTDRDVHLAAGLSCTDCHRNGLDHAIVRGEESPPGPADPARAGLSCRGCHLGLAGAAPGRLGAPVPRHPGLPAVHIEKLSCTACHAGPWPTPTARRVQTSRAHALEFHGGHRADDARPEIFWPVFVRNARGKIEPRKMLFPSFFGRSEAVPERRMVMTPLDPEEVAAAAEGALADATLGDGLTPRRIAAVLKALADAAPDRQAPVYVAAGRMHRLGPRGELLSSEALTGRPVSWPVAHPVRAAARSLGAEGRCTDCHDPGAPMLFGKVAPAGPAGLAGVERAMHEFQGLDPLYQRCLGWTWLFRPWLKLTGFASSAVVLALMLLYALPAAMLAPAAGAARRVPRRWGRLVAAAVLGSFLILAATGFYPVLLGEQVGGWLLMVHVTLGGVFAFALAAAAITWAGRARPRRPGGFGPFALVLFWSAMAAGAVTVLSMMLSMVRLFSPEELELLRQVHRYAGLALVLLFVAAIAGAAGRRRRAER